ncbi:MAG: alpha-glucan family phosphorylase, partial [Acidobacteria bacterium]|nr:alpha-glucan family phosphorylase [Acidobacteriota bacterium]
MEAFKSHATDIMRASATRSRGTSEPETSDVFRDNFYLSRNLPDRLAILDEISLNFAWSWLDGGTDIFRDLDSRLWEKCEQNPRLLLERIGDLRLWQRVSDGEYLARLGRFEKAFFEYTAATPVESGRVTEENPAAYFCAEFGVHNSLPIYSGGLGILAGDHLKSASDLNVPLVAVGLLYRYGYFRQLIRHDGWQEERYDDLFHSELALQPVIDQDGNPMTVSVHIRGREVKARAWLAKVGRVSLYLLDSHLAENKEIDRLITGHLYGGSTETRIVQEKLLGIGGVRLLKKLKIEPSVFHLNEGHSAFLTLELAKQFLEAKTEATFSNARETVQSRCVFTTHTPVEAGNDTFDPTTLLACFDPAYFKSLKISTDEFLALGRTVPENSNEYFGMTPFAIRMSGIANGVAEKHGSVSRSLWQKMFRDAKSADDVPITHVTNAVHPSSWIAPPFRELFKNRLGENWQLMLRDRAAWASAIEKIPDRDVWDAHSVLKSLLIAYARWRLLVKDAGEKETINEHVDTRKIFDPHILTIGFARRVAAYKRWNLILSDLNRLLKLVDHPERPVQFIFAGKAHPQDKTAKEILQQLMSIDHNSQWQNRAVFIEDYDQEVARYLVHGVD